MARLFVLAAFYEPLSDSPHRLENPSCSFYC
jgi:hypothetical protein